MTVESVGTRPLPGFGMVPSHWPSGRGVCNAEVPDMYEVVPCSGGDHRAPGSGGSCPCGMVTRIPARAGVRTASPFPDLRDVLARCLYDGPGDPLAPDALDLRPSDIRISGLLRQRADQVLAALAAAGVVLTAEERLPA